MTPARIGLIVIALALVVESAIGYAVASLMRVAAPQNLWLLLVPVGIIASYVLYGAVRRRALGRLGQFEQVRAMAATVSPRRRAARVALIAAAATLLAVAAARPQWGEKNREIQRKGIDVVIALDLSRSMWAVDVAPNRLEAARYEIDQLLRRLDGDRVGLVVFAADAVKQSPLTSDYGAIRHYLDQVDPNHFSRQGTAIGRAIGASHELLTGTSTNGAEQSDPSEEESSASDFRRAETQLIIVVSDGEDRITDPISAAQFALDDGIRTYTIGIGTPEGARIPIRDREGRILEYLEDPRTQQEVVSRLVEDQLVATAQSGGGAYQRYSGEGSVATFIEESIAQYDEEALSSMLTVEYEDRYEFFAFPALLLLLLAGAISDRRRNAQLILAAAVVWSSAGCEDALLRPDPVVERALEAYGDGEYDEAWETLESATTEAREQESFAYDNGLVNVGREDLDDARDDFLRALGSVDEALQTRALFGLGNTLFAEENWEAAIERYRRVLLLDPTHDGARRNLEIALRRLYPPCSTFEDDWEENDSPADAPLLPSSAFDGDFLPPGIEPPAEDAEDVEFTACPLDVDFLAIPTMGGAQLDIEVTFTRLREDVGRAPLPEFVHPTTIRITLLDYEGTEAIALDQGLNVEEVVDVSARRVVRRLEGVEIDPSWGQDITTFLQIEVDGPTEYKYEVAVEMTPPCYALEDSFEANDLRSTARVMENGQHSARLCESNDDWYEVAMQEGDALFIDAYALQLDSGDPGTYTAELYVNEEEEPLQSFELSPELTMAPFAIRESKDIRRVQLRITGGAEGNEGNYRIDIYHFAPCPTGNDRFEPNDSPNARSAIGADPQNPPPYRHLRICEGDTDWFEYTLPPPEEDEEGNTPETRPFSVLVEYDRPAARRTYAYVYSNTTPLQMLATSQPVEARAEADVDPPPTIGVPGQPTQSPGQPTSPQQDPGSPTQAPAPPQPVAFGEVAALELDADVQSVVIQVSGSPGFYHLAFPDTQQQQQEQQEQQEQDDSDSEDGDPEEQESDSEPDDGEDDAESEETDNGEEQDESEAPGEEQNDSGPEQAPTPEPSGEEMEREELRDLLESLEADDVNLQIQQALQDLPPEQFEEAW